MFQFIDTLINFKVKKSHKFFKNSYMYNTTYLSYIGNIM